MYLRSALLLLSCLHYGHGQAVENLRSALSRQDLFVNGAKYDITYPCYRQPAIVQASSVLLAFAEGRNLSFAQCAPPLHLGARQKSAPNEIGGLVLRRSLDGGQTWSLPRTIYSGNIDFYTVTYDTTTGIVWLMLQKLFSVLVFTSTDGGLHWSPPQPLNATPPAPPLKISAPAVGHGIQLQSDMCEVSVVVCCAMDRHINISIQRHTL